MLYVMEFFTFLLGLLLIVSLLGLGRRFKSKHTISNLPPGPWKLPFIGNLHQLFAELPHRNLRDLANKYGPLMHLQIGEVSHVVVSSPEIAKQVLKTHDAIFSTRPPIIAIKILCYDCTGVSFSPYGDYWRQVRRICNSELLSPKRVQTFASLRKEQTLNLMEWIASNEGKPINLTEKVFALIYSTTSLAAFGKKSEDHESFQNLTIQALKFGSGFNLADFYPSVKLFHHISGVKPALERLHSQIDRILDKLISDHRSTAEDHKSLLDGLLKHQDESTEFHLTNDNIKAILLDIFSGGSETPATTIDWAMSEMIKNPSILRRAQEEVRHAFSSEGYVVEEKLDDLKYITSIIKETLRFHPPSPLTLPRQNDERVEINGYEIPARTKIIVNAWAINRDPSYWEDAECFRPERFLDSLIDFKGRHFEYIPFGAGRRMCPGMTFAWASVLLPIAHLLYHFDWNLPNGMKCEDLDMTESFGLAVERKNNLYLIPNIRNPLRICC